MEAYLSRHVSISAAAVSYTRRRSRLSLQRKVELSGELPPLRSLPYSSNGPRKLRSSAQRTSFVVLQGWGMCGGARTKVAAGP